MTFERVRITGGPFTKGMKVVLIRSDGTEHDLTDAVLAIEIAPSDGMAKAKLTFFGESDLEMYHSPLPKSDRPSHLEEDAAQLARMVLSGSPPAETEHQSRAVLARYHEEHGEDQTR